MSRGTLDTGLPACFSLTGLLPSMVEAFLPLILLNIHGSLRQSTTPYYIAVLWFGLFRFRSPLLTKSLLFSFPVGT